MAKLKFRSSALIKGSKEKAILAVQEGQILPEIAQELGLLVYEPKDQEPVYYYDHPTNIMAIRSMKAVYRNFGFQIKIELKDARGRDLKKLLHPREVHYYSRRYNKTFATNDGIQAPVAFDKMALGIMAKNHPRLASAAILYLIEDYDPEDMYKKMRKDPKRGEVWGHCQKMSKAEKLHTGYDFKITMCKTIWDRLDGPTKRYMIDHEQMHCGRSERGKWEVWPHDIECFSEELSRYSGRIKEIDRLVDNITAMSSKKKKRKKKTT